MGLIWLCCVIFAPTPKKEQFPLNRVNNNNPPTVVEQTPLFLIQEMVTDSLGNITIREVKEKKDSILKAIEAEKPTIEEKAEP